MLSRMHAIRSTHAVVGLRSVGPRLLSTVNLKEKRKPLQRFISGLAEVQQTELFKKQLSEGSTQAAPKSGLQTLEEAGMSKEEFRAVLRGGFCTALLHTEARVASALGEGFYTIGPGGEELVGAGAHALRETDSVALHYRHLSTSIVRQELSGKALDDILLDRARGYVVSSLDPVTGGRHCALGGSEYDFLVTSTLASQAPPAVGRAMGAQLAHALRQPSLLPRDAVSFVSLGDGSVNNAHFLSAVNLSQYAEHRKFSCPVVYAISDNDRCISLRGYGWLKKFTKALQMRVYTCNGNNALDVYAATQKAVKYSRKAKRPSTIVMNDLVRRFGHAATDRQDAYLTTAEIRGAAEDNALGGACRQAVELGIATWEELHAEFLDLEERTATAFQKAVNEPKITDVKALLESNSQPIAPLAKDMVAVPKSVRQVDPDCTAVDVKSLPKEKQPTVMRKNMNRVVDEMLAKYPNLVYVGEDVAHGGYYLVTEGLDAKYPHRVRDFPPDETTLVGAAMGYSQVGLLPILEIPYAKYLDCGADMFYEAAISNWLSNSKAPNGMLVRLQGFGRGVFGGNFHTHNVLSLPPGVDVLCYSNGEDYVRGFRNMVHQAANGRMVMSVDSTNLLNLRHLHERDDGWQRAYPEDEREVLTFDDVIKYGSGNSLAIVTYGNGVVVSLQARKALMEEHGWDDVTVIDSPLLSGVAGELRAAVGDYERVLFVDECKDRQYPLAGIANELHNDGALSGAWRTVAAPNTYNPLGITISFVNAEDVVAAAGALQ